MVHRAARTLLTFLKPLKYTAKDDAQYLKQSTSKQRRGSQKRLRDSLHKHIVTAKAFSVDTRTCGFHTKVTFNVTKVASPTL